MFKLFTNIGSRLKWFSKILFIGGLAAAGVTLIVGFMSLSYMAGIAVFQGILSTLLNTAVTGGTLIAFSLLLNGIGEMVCCAQDSRYYLQKLANTTEIAPERREQVPVQPVYQAYQAPVPAPAPAPAPAPVPQAGVKQCKQCGNVGAFERFCPNCGTDNA